MEEDLRCLDHKKQRETGCISAYDVIKFHGIWLLPWKEVSGGEICTENKKYKASKARIMNNILRKCSKPLYDFK